MEGFKEFQGKNLDTAIREACYYYDAPREKLEIEIIQDAKSGIFGIVGARKAKIQARRVQLREAVEDILGRNGRAADKKHEKPAHTGDEKPVTGSCGCAEAETSAHAGGPEPSANTGGEAENSSSGDRSAKAESRGVRSGTESAKAGRPCREARSGSRGGRTEKSCGEAGDGCDTRSRAGEQPAHADCREEPEEQCSAGAAGAASGGRGERVSAGENRQGDRPRGRNSRSGESQAAAEATPEVQDAEASVARTDAGDTDSAGRDAGDPQQAEGFRMVPLEELDTDKVREFSLDVVRHLITPIVGDIPLQVELADNRVNVMLDCGDDSGLLIGREGQTLASLQYLASRIVSRRMDAAVRVHLDAGAYRQRQDEKLREMALALAEKVRATGRSYSTRPLSSYHRRIIHMALQDCGDLQTRSSGEGSIKRVVILRKRQ